MSSRCRWEGKGGGANEPLRQEEHAAALVVLSHKRAFVSFVSVPPFRMGIVGRIRSMARYYPRRTSLDERDLRRLTLRIPTEMHEALRTLAGAKFESMNVAARQAIHEFLLREGTWEPVERWLLRTGERYRVAMDGVREAEEAAEEADGARWPLLS